MLSFNFRKYDTMLQRLSPLTSLLISIFFLVEKESSHVTVYHVKITPSISLIATAFTLIQPALSSISFSNSSLQIPNIHHQQSISSRALPLDSPFHKQSKPHPLVI